MKKVAWALLPLLCATLAAGCTSGGPQQPGSPAPAAGAAAEEEAAHVGGGDDPGPGATAEPWAEQVSEPAWTYLSSSWTVSEHDEDHVIGSDDYNGTFTLHKTTGLNGPNPGWVGTHDDDLHISGDAPWQVLLVDQTLVLRDAETGDEVKSIPLDVDELREGGVNNATYVPDNYLVLTAREGSSGYQWWILDTEAGTFTERFVEGQVGPEVVGADGFLMSCEWATGISPPGSPPGHNLIFAQSDPGGPHVWERESRACLTFEDMMLVADRDDAGEYTHLMRLDPSSGLDAWDTPFAGPVDRILGGTEDHLVLSSATTGVVALDRATGEVVSSFPQVDAFGDHLSVFHPVTGGFFLSTPHTDVDGEVHYFSTEVDGATWQLPAEDLESWAVAYAADDVLVTRTADGLAGYLPSAAAGE